MPYSVGEAAKILNVAPSTLRYYDKEGLLPFVERSEGGMRVFCEEDFSWLFLVECLKMSGLSIKEIKHYMDLTLLGDKTIDARLEIFKKQREKVISQMNKLQQTLETLDYKCWYYETAKKAGSTAVHKNMPDDKIPPRFRRAKQQIYNHKLHSNKEAENE